VTYLRQGLDLVAKLPCDREQMRLELRLLLALGPPLQQMQGYGAADVETTYARASIVRAGRGAVRAVPGALGVLALYLRQRETQRGKTDRRGAPVDRRTTRRPGVAARGASRAVTDHTLDRRPGRGTPAQRAWDGALRPRAASLARLSLRWPRPGRLLP